MYIYNSVKLYSNVPIYISSTKQIINTINYLLHIIVNNNNNNNNNVWE